MMFKITKEHIIGFMAAIIYMVYSFTFRYRVFLHPDIINDMKKKGDLPGSGILIAFWHQDDLAAIPYFAFKKIMIMVSLSKDGRILATALRIFGYKVISGSSSRRSIAVFIEALKKLKRGASFAIAVDGPRGPIFEAKEGVIKLSEKSQRQIYPLRAFPEKYFMFKKAWNKPRLPLPFSKIFIVCGKPGFYSREELSKEINSIKLPPT